jgi:hypothetical protein
MIPTSIRVTAVLAALLAATACGSSTQTSTGSTPTPTPTATASTTQHVTSADACTLVTADEASAAVGEAVTSLAGVQIPNACIYGSSGSSSTVLVFAQVYPDATAANAVQPDQLAAIFASQLAFANAHAVNGVGDKAFEYTLTGSGGGGIALLVFKYNVVLIIAVDPTSDSNAIEGLARTAVGRLVVA